MVLPDSEDVPRPGSLGRQRLRSPLVRFKNLPEDINNDNYKINDKPRERSIFLGIERKIYPFSIAILTISFFMLQEMSVADERGLRRVSERRVALVIGNASYKEMPLKNPVNDAGAMSHALLNLGFEVIERKNASKVQMEDAVAEFGERLESGGVGLVYYSGHGMQVNGKNYLIPVDAQITSEQTVPLRTLDADNVLNQMMSARSRVNVVILDACRNNPFERRFRSVGGGLAQMSAPEGTIVAYSTAPGKVASDGDGVNGLYTQELLKVIQQPGLPIEHVFKQVRSGVLRISNNAQAPWESSSLLGDFYFRPPEPGQANAIEQMTDTELLYWNSIQDSPDVEPLRAFVSKFPEGRFADLAKIKIVELERKKSSSESDNNYNSLIQRKFTPEQQKVMDIFNKL
ncbi:MAG: hypothetical protein HW380_3002 [Magnetococcales bacterium]|nr:hypothetical protein [Magnetococcales bacterium]HIJ82729.1 hypothetical protein [Magnetococcales bacterium]